MKTTTCLLFTIFISTVTVQSSNEFNVKYVKNSDGTWGKIYIDGEEELIQPNGIEFTQQEIKKLIRGKKISRISYLGANGFLNKTDFEYSIKPPFIKASQKQEIKFYQLINGKIVLSGPKEIKIVRNQIAEILAYILFAVFLMWMSFFAFKLKYLWLRRSV
jgi:hypothetical protein